MLDLQPPLPDTLAHSPTLSKATPLPFTINNYTFVEHIGRGGFAEVFLVRHLDFAQDYVAKVMTFDRSEIGEKWRAFENEVRALLTLMHPNVIRMYDYFYVGSQFYLILEYCSGGCLSDEITEGDGVRLCRFLRIAADLSRALEYCHSMNIAHHDIKPGNILFDERKGVKLADFGLSLIATAGQKTKHFGGSMLFLAPENRQKKAHDPMPGDVWALGVVFTMMLTGGSPWKYSDLGELKQKCAQGLITFKKRMPPMLEDLVRQMLAPDPAARLTMRQVAQFPLFQEESSLETIATRTIALNWDRIPRGKSDVRCDLPSGSQGGVRHGFVASASAALRDSLSQRKRPLIARGYLLPRKVPADTFSGFSDDIQERNPA
jgi:serine/threonine protein kinase